MKNYFVVSMLLILMISLLSASCNDDDDSNDGGSSGDDDATDDDTTDDDDDATGDDDDDDNNDDDTWDNLSDLLGSGEVRAGIITAEDELIGGPRARGEIGDFKIYNSQIEVIIRSTDLPGIGWTTYSGNIIDADRARPKNDEGKDSLWAHEQVAGILRGFFAKGVEIAQSGHDGQAIIRVIGKDGGIHIVDGVVPLPDAQLDFVTEYILLPDTDYLKIKTTLINKKSKDRNVLIADIGLWADETRIFSPRAGFETGEFDLFAGLRWIGGVNNLGLPVSYALATADPDKNFYAPYIDKEIIPMVDGFLDLPANDEASYERLFIVGNGDTSLFNSTLNDYDESDDFVVLEGQVVFPAGSDLEGVEVVVTDQRPAGSNHVGVLWPDANGEFTLEVPKGVYTLVASAEGRLDSAPVVVDLSTKTKATVTVQIGEPGFFSYTIVDQNDDPLPGKIFFQPGHNATSDAYISRRVWSVTGQGTERVTPGDYTVTASHGMEYEIYSENITIQAGDTASFDAQIGHVVDTSGHMTGDFHIHTQFSMDSEVIAQTRIKELASAGIEMPVITDHDYQSDYSVYVEELGIENLIRPVVGTEVSPYYGHFNSWPMTKPDYAPDYYGVPMVEYDEDQVIVKKYEHPDMWDIARNDFGAQVIQINHPRSSSSGWFNYVNYDPSVGVGSVWQWRWRDDFDAIEVFNSGANHEGSLDDWFSFLDQGLNYTLTGNSDSHTITSELGNPRNVFAMPTDDPVAADPMDMVDAILNHENQVSNGPFIQFSISGESIGGSVSLSPGSDVDIQIRVQAPLWVEMDYLRVYSNNMTIVTEIALSSTGTVVRYDDTVTLTPASDAYYVVEAGHTSATLGPVIRGERVFGMTNPIWVDIDGSGTFNPPGLAAATYKPIRIPEDAEIEPESGLIKYVLEHHGHVHNHHHH